MAPIIRKRSLSDMQHAGSTTTAVLPAEYSDVDYVREVLHWAEGQTETVFDSRLNEVAEELGILISRPSSPILDPALSTCESSITTDLKHSRTVSQHSRSTTRTSTSSGEYQEGFKSLHLKKRPSTRKSLSFSEYEKYIVQTEVQQTKDSGFMPPPMPAEPAPSLFSVSSRKSYQSLRNGIKNRFRLRKSKPDSPNNLNSCVCCREDFKMTNSLHTLPCLHNYCDACLRVIISQASTEESKMPPKCCGRPLPGQMIKSLLSRDEQDQFMKSVLQFSTPWEARVFCPNPVCGEFIPKRAKIDPKQPFEVICGKCRTRACSICKRASHAVGKDCPADWELDAVLQMGEKSGWRRCYKCRNLVELTQGCSHITCRCKAQFCYICGAVWDPTVGCPNYCNGEEELERRRAAEAARIAEEVAESIAREEAERVEAAEKIASEKRTKDSPELNALRLRQIDERDRFCSFERKMKWIMWTRHGRSKLGVLEKYDELQAKMRERHARTAAHLEDRQVAAEMELRASLKQSERSVAIRLRHMEAYCDGLGRSANGGNPARIVTERDLRELGQQYNVRDDMERFHQSKINVMRDKQAKQMEHLLARQEEDLQKLATKQADELESLVDSFGLEEEGFLALFDERKLRLIKRWSVSEEIERKRLEIEKGSRFAALAPLQWPSSDRRESDGLDDVAE